ncbi:MAG: hypothetical protein ACYC3L_13545 [Gemmatimonadaceae bacterium]
MLAIPVATLVALMAAFGAPPRADTLSVAAVQAHYADMFRLDTVSLGGKTGYTLAVTPDAAPAWAAAFLREHKGLVAYVVMHGPTFRVDSVAGGAPSPAVRQARYAEALRRDQTFNATFLPMLARYLRAHGGVLTGMSDVAIDSLSMRVYVRTAVRFFDPYLDADGTFGGTHICQAVNGVLEIRPAPPLALQALAYVTVGAEAQPTTGRWRFGKDFQTAQRLIGRLALGDNPPVLLERARGVMWGVMAASDSLSVVLREGYALHAEVLPFTLVP